MKRIGLKVVMYIVSTGLLGCSSPPTTPQAPVAQGKSESNNPPPAYSTMTKTKAESPPAGAFEGILTVSKANPAEHRMQFFGTTLQDTHNTTWVLGYQRDPLFVGFDGFRVLIAGDTYEPMGRAISGKHIKVKWIKLIDQSNEAKNAPIVEVWEEKTYEGELQQSQGPVGSKSEGETLTYFVTKDGTHYWLMNRPEKMPLRTPTTIRARRVEPSLYVTRHGGQYLWVVDKRTGDE